MVGVRGLEPRASCSQSRRATNCATPRFLFPGQREVFPKSMPCICLHLKKHAVFPKCSCLYSITDFSEKCQLHLSIQSPTKTCKNAKPPVPSPFLQKRTERRKSKATPSLRSRFPFKGPLSPIKHILPGTASFSFSLSAQNAASDAVLKASCPSEQGDGHSGSATGGGVCPLLLR